MFTKAIKLSLIFFDKSLNGADFSCIVLPRLLRPLSDKNIKSVPITCIESLAIHPTPTITSFNAKLFTSSAFEYITMLRSQNITRKLL